MIDSQIVAFTFAAAVLTVTPGQDTMLVVRNVLRGGRCDGVVTALAFVRASSCTDTLGPRRVGHLDAFRNGLSTGQVRWRVLLGVAGRPLAVQCHARGTPSRRLRASACPRRRITPALFSRRRVSNVLNPKTAVFYLAFLPQFIGHEYCRSPSCLRVSIMPRVSYGWWWCPWGWIRRADFS